MEDNQQELIYKLQMFEQHMAQLQQQMQAVERGILELSDLSLGLDDLIGAKDKETMSLIGKGIFAKTKLISEELVVDIGGKNFVTKSIPQTKEMIAKQIEKLNDVKSELNTAMENVGEEFQRMIMDFQNQEHHCCGHSHDGEHCGDEECNCEHSHDKEHECCGKHENCECGDECGCDEEYKNN